MEEKSVIVKNEKVYNNYLHDDIILSILSKLPLKSLKRFECVRKSWSLLFENSYFMNMLRNNFLSKDSSYCHNTSFLLQRCIPNKVVSDLYSLSGERFENKVKLDLPDPFQEDTETLLRLYRFDILNLSSINDFICVKCHLRHNFKFDARIALWNPTTDEFKVIPPNPVKCLPFAANASHNVINFDEYNYVHGFGYDPVTDDYKVLYYVLFLAPFRFTRDYVPLRDTSPEPLWEIYSLRSNSWRKLDFVMPTSFGTTMDAKVYMDGLCHWWCLTVYESCLVSFDLSNEVFFTTPIPSDIDDNLDGECLWRHLAVLNQSIALIAYHSHLTTFNISILGELSVKESWTKLFIVGPLPCVERPFGVGKGKIFFARKDKELAWFDLSTQMIEQLDVKGEALSCWTVFYKENLLPIG